MSTNILTPPPPHAPMELILLGPPELHCGNFVLSGHAKPRLLCLLAYLAVEGAVSKAALAALFWPDVAQAQARANLRQLLHRLRAEVAQAERLLAGQGETLGVAAAVQVDSRRFLAAPAGPAPAEEMAARLAAYRGEFLQDLPQDGLSAGLAEWLDATRKRCRDQAALLALSLASALARVERDGEALHYAVQALECDRSNQKALHLAMLIHSRMQAPQQALALYRKWERRIVSEAAVLPAPETYALYQRILQNAREQGAGGFDSRILSVLALVWPLPGSDDDAEAEIIERLHVRCSAALRPFGAHLVDLPQGGLLAYFGYANAKTHAAMTAVRAVDALYRDVPASTEAVLALHTGVTLCNARTPDVTGMLTRAVLATAASASAAELLAVTPAACAALGTPPWLVPAAAEPAMAAPAAVARYRMQWQRWRAAEGARPAVPALQGRSAELALLRARWQAAQGGACVMLQLSGAAGMGKSHLISSFLAQAGPAQVLLAQCDPFAVDTPLQAILAMFEQAAQAPDGTAVRQAMLRHVPLSAAAAAGAVAQAPGHSAGPAVRPVTLEALEQVIDGLCAVLAELAAMRPVLLVIEDVHWADPSTRRFLANLAQQAAAGGASPALILASTRDPAPLWPQPSASSGRPAPPISHLLLAALDAAAGQALVQARNPTLAPPQVAQIVAMGGGHPLFLAELASRPDEQELPSSIRELTQIKLDQLGPARRTAQLAAILGLSFKRHWLEAVVQAQAPAADHASLDALRDSGLLRGGATLEFSHALLRDAVVALLPAGQFKELSGLVGATLSAQFPADLAGMPEHAARWFTDAQAWQEALAWRLQAGQAAIALFAYPEALHHMNAGLALLPQLATESERDDWERRLRGSLPYAVTAVHGLTSSASTLHYQRMARLTEQSAAMQGDFSAMRAMMSTVEGQQGQHALLRLVQRFLRTPAVRQADPLTLLRLQEVHCNTLYLTGRIRQARAVVASQLAAPAALPAGRTSGLMFDPAMVIGARSALLGLLNGDWDAYAQAERRLAAARTSPLPCTLLYVMIIVISAHLSARLPQRAAGLIEEMLTLSDQLGVGIFKAFALGYRESCRILAGAACANADMQAAIDNMNAHLPHVAPTLYLHQAESLLAQGDRAGALAALEHGEAGMRRYRMLYHRPEFLILRARLASERQAAMTLLERAYRLATRQGSHLFAVRARLAQARLCQGDPAVLQRLADLLARLPAGAHLPDLADSRDVLAASGIAH